MVVIRVVTLGRKTWQRLNSAPTRKYSTKINQNFLVLTGKLAPLQKSTAYGLLCSSTQWRKRMAKKEVVLVEFLCVFN